MATQVLCFRHLRILIDCRGLIEALIANRLTSPKAMVAVAD